MTFVARKALCYFEGGDLATLEAPLQQQLIAAAARELEILAIALRSPRLD